MFSTPNGLSSAVTEAARRSSLDTQRAVESFWHDRFLCRVFSGDNPEFILKGGQGMLARFNDARVTRDIDLVADSDDITDAIAKLDALAAINLGDFMRFRRIGSFRPIQADEEYRPGVSLRYEVFVGDGRKGTISVDLVVGEVLYGKPNKIIPKHRLDVSGLEEHDYLIYSIEDAIADKVGATLQRYNDDKPSTRVKDLVDITLIAHEQSIKGSSLTSAIEREGS